jgi:2-polyprenyl-6-methoxyphenol hydroxylase-like FAD-dependent oxidoreductase
MALPTCDVLVVGAGPAGLTCAAALARAGVRVLVVERHDGLSMFPKASGVRPRTMEILRSWGLGEKVNRAAQRVRLEQAGSRTLADGVTDVASLGVPPPAALAGVSPEGFVFCPQDLLEPVLLESVRSHGGQAWFGTGLVGLSMDPTGVTARLRRRDVDEPTFDVCARYVVGADGPRSTVRSALGIEVEQLGSLGNRLSVLFQADLGAVLPDPPYALHQVTLAGAEGLFVATGSQRWVYDREWHPDQGETLASQTEALVTDRIRRAAGLPGLAVQVLGLFPWAMSAEVATRYRSGSAFLIGDAAARTTPRGATGMNTGIAAGHNLAWKLAWVLRGWAGDALLDSYAQEREPVGLANALRSLDFADRRPESPLAHDFGVRYASDAIVDGDATSTVPSPLGAAPLPGMRAPHAWVRLDGRPVSTLDLFEGTLTLLVGPAGSEWSAVAERLTLPCPLRALRLGHDLPDPEQALARLYGVGDRGAVLVRPDGHVAWMTESGPAATRIGLAEAVRRATGRATTRNRQPRAPRPWVQVR